MTQRRWARLATGGQEGGFTLIELLVAAAMGVVLMAAISTLVIGAVRNQPEISKRAENISTARWVLERLVREIRNGVLVESTPKPTASEVSFRTFVRSTSCGGSGAPAAGEPAILCKVTYSCSGSTCRRDEVDPGKSTPRAPGGSSTGGCRPRTYSPICPTPPNPPTSA